MNIADPLTVFEIPVGVTHFAYVNGMRELRSYWISLDSWIVRWDMEIDGVQYCRKSIPPVGMTLSIDDWIIGERVNAKRDMINAHRDGVQSKVEIGHGALW